MKNKKIAVELQNAAHRYEIEVSHDALAASGEWARRCLSESAKKIVVVTNEKVFRLYGAAVVNGFGRAGYETSVFKMKDGEKHKNFRTVEQALRFFGANKLTRTDAVVALGGGVVGDLAGFAAAIHLRGIRFLQIPTTLLAMIDSSVGGKTGVNGCSGKNTVGAFHQPHGVLIDAATLQTLAKRELTAGFCEAVKQAAISDQTLFDQTAAFLEKYSPLRFRRYFSDEDFINRLENLIRSQVAFKTRIVIGDEREDAARGDAQSRKILNFGHTLAHALEKVTDYKRFKHGEAVGYGVLFAGAISKKLDILDQNTLKLLNDVLRCAGKLPDARDISPERIYEAFAFDKKTIENSLQWILLRSIGQPTIVENKEIPAAVLKETLGEILRGESVLNE